MPFCPQAKLAFRKRNKRHIAALALVDELLSKLGVPYCEAGIETLLPSEICDKLAWLRDDTSLFFRGFCDRLIVLNDISAWLEIKSSAAVNLQKLRLHQQLAGGLGLKIFYVFLDQGQLKIAPVQDLAVKKIAEGRSKFAVVDMIKLKLKLEEYLKEVKNAQYN